MAKVVGVINTSHSPFCYLPADQWAAVREGRPPYREDVPYETDAEMVDKAERVQRGFATLRDKIAELHPDVIVLFGDDQDELFDFSNHPAIAVYVGESFEGPIRTADARLGRDDAPREKKRVASNPGLAVSVLTGLLDRGFDPAFMMDLPKPEHGMGHAVMRPLESLTQFDIPTLPLLLNAYYAPQLTATRCYEVGRAVREIIDAYPEDLRVLILGSGGLWHTPGQKGSFLDEEFDRTGLAYLEKGDIKSWAEHFDAYHVADDDPSQDSMTVRRGVTGLPTPGGPQGGTRESCNWIAAAAVIEGRPSVVVDYIPIYSSPIGVGFAYAEL